MLLGASTGVTSGALFFGFMLVFGYFWADADGGGWQMWLFVIVPLALALGGIGYAIGSAGQP